MQKTQAYSEAGNFFFSSIRSIREILSPAQRKHAVLAIFFILIAAILDVFSLASVMPLVLLVLDTSLIHSNEIVHMLYERLGFSSDNQFIIAVVLVMLVLFIVKNIGNVLITHFQSRFIYGVATDLSRRGFIDYFARGFSFFTGTNSSLPARNILDIPIQFAVNILLAMITLSSEAIVFILIVGGIAIYNPHVFLLLILILGPPFIAVYYLKRNKMEEIGSISDELRPLSMQHLYQGINSYMESRLYGKEPFFINRFISLHDRLNRNFARFYTYSLIPQRVIEVIAVLGVVFILAYSLMAQYERNNIIILLSLFAAAAYRVMPSVNRMFMALMNIKTFQYTIGILREISTSRPPLNGRQRADSLFQSGIKFDNISFTYPGTAAPQLDKVNFEVSCGETIGIVGPSGSGKTTLMLLLLRFLKEDEGVILVDDIPLRDETKRSWRELIGYVKQNPFILDASLRENIAFGIAPEEIDERWLDAVIDQAGLRVVVDNLPQGADTVIGEQGARISGGQRQRIVIARALYRNAQILVFDEATSELDSTTEQEILSSIKQLAGEKRTIFIIAHRMSTLTPCDRILEIRDGKVRQMNRKG